MANKIAHLRKYANIIQSLPTSEFEAYKESFQFFDRDGKGYITDADFRDALKRMGQKPTDEEVQQLCDEYDISGDGKVYFEEMVVVASKRRDGVDVEKEAKLRTTFRKLDVNKTGTLGKEEILELLSELGNTVRTLSEDYLDRLLEGRKDGRIRLDDFMDVVMPTVKPTKIRKDGVFHFKIKKEKDPEPGTQEEKDSV